MSKQMLAYADIILKDAIAITTVAYATTTNSVSMKAYPNVLAVLIITDAGTGCVVTMKQGTTTTANTALSFSRYYYKADTDTNTWVEGSATANTFTTGTGTTQGMYAVPISGDMLTDTYFYVRLNAASTTASTAGVLMYLPYNARYPNDPSTMIDASS